MHAGFGGGVLACMEAGCRVGLKDGVNVTANGLVNLILLGKCALGDLVDVLQGREEGGVISFGAGERTGIEGLHDEIVEYLSIFFGG